MIYVASSWRNQFQPWTVEQLRLAGFEVYDFRNPAPGDHGFSWSQVGPRWRTWTTREYLKALSHPIAEDGFRKDERALHDCTSLVLVLPSGRSAHLEAGFAAGQGKPVYIFAPGPVEPELMVKLCTGGYFAVLDELIQTMQKRRHS